MTKDKREVGRKRSEATDVVRMMSVWWNGQKAYRKRLQEPIGNSRYKWAVRNGAACGGDRHPRRLDLR
jgi:hypothetical protein